MLGSPVCSDWRALEIGGTDNGATENHIRPTSITFPVRSFEPKICRNNKILNGSAD
jgi:hypothetical protein